MKLFKYSILLLVSLVITISCGKDDDGSNSVDPITFLVKDASTWSIENPDIDGAEGASVKIYADLNAFESNTPELELIADDEGKAEFTGTPGRSYYFLVSKDSKTNIPDGYLITGVFQTQEELDGGADQSAVQTDTKVGSVKIQDTNADGVINEMDKISGVSFTYPEHASTLEVIIGEINP